jgi:hypothetical protein
MARRGAGLLEALRASAPAQAAAAVTPNDGVDLPGGLTIALYVGGVGTLRVTMADGVVANFAAVPAGTTLEIQVTRVHATGTTATSIVALYA